jgi:thioredoxin-dependent peroxiredoxin
MNMMKSTLLAACAALLCVLNLAAAPLKAGDPAPDFSLQGSDGKTYKLSELKGKNAVIAWFPKAFTGGCTTECKAMKAAGEDLKKFNVNYFTASVDDADTKRPKLTECSMSAAWPIAGPFTSIKAAKSRTSTSR